MQLLHSGPTPRLKSSLIHTSIGILLLLPLNLNAADIELVGAQQGLTQILNSPTQTSKPRVTKDPKQTRKQLLEEVLQFQKEKSSLKPEVAAEQWLDLLKRYLDLPRGRQDHSFRYMQFMNQTGEQLNFQTLLQSIPEPDAWKSIRTLILKDPVFASQETATACGIRAIIHYINKDFTSFDKELAEMEGLAKNLKTFQKQDLMNTIKELHQITQDSSLKEGNEHLKAHFIQSLETKANSTQMFKEIIIPDVYALFPENEASALIDKVLKIKYVLIKVPSGGKSLEVVKQRVLENIESLDLPQWQLVTSSNDVQLFEAIHQKFPSQLAEKMRMFASSFKSSDSQPRDDFQGSLKADRDKANLLYIAGLIKENRIDKAVSFTLSLPIGQPSHYAFKKALRTIHQGKHSGALFSYCKQVLDKKPETEIWPTFLYAAIAKTKWNH